MSYGDSKLDLTSMSVACLSGPNGAGKSAILDAVTWCLWESARSTSDELIRAGELDMYVDLVFELENSTYRVRRSRQRTFPRAGVRALSKGGLDFQIWQLTETAKASKKKRGQSPQKALIDAPPLDDAPDGKWHSLTGANMRDTQLRICEVLRMDYDTFINSVYLRQGRADEFTTRAPADRKQVLGEILGLSYFDRLQERARDESRKRKSKIDSLQGSMGDSVHIGESLAQLQEWLAAAQAHANVTGEQIEATTIEYIQLKEQLDELSALESKMEPTQMRLSELQKDIDMLCQSESDLAATRDRLAAVLAEAGSLEEASTEFKSTKQRVEQLDKTSFERQEFEARRMELKSTIAAMRGRMEVELEHLISQTGELKIKREKLESDLLQRDKIETDHAKYKKLLADEAEMSRKQESFVQLTARCEQLHTTIVETRLHLEAELEHKADAVKELASLIQNKETTTAEHADLIAQVEDLDNLEVEFVHVEESGLKLKQEIDHVNSQVEQLQRQIAENHDKAHELQKAHSLTMCPLCAAPIVDRDAVMQRYEKLNDQLLAEIQHLNNRTAELESKRTLLRQRYMEIRRRLDSRKGLDTKIGEYNARMAALERADANYNRLVADVASITKRLTEQQYAVVERESLINLKAEIHKLEFDPLVYTSLQSQLRAQRHAEVRHQQLRKDAAELEKLALQIPQLQERVNQLHSQLANEDFAQDSRAGIIAIEKQLEEYEYDRSEHQVLRERLSKLLPMVERFKELDKAKAELPPVESQLQAVADQISNKKSQHSSVQQSALAWIQRLSQKDSLLSRQVQLESSTSELQKQKADLAHEIAVLDTKLTQQLQERERFEATQKEINDLIAEMNDYEMLAESFGKKGIQAIIIENAVPEIEAETNNILSRLSDNMMHVGLITQHKTKQGNLQETLEIMIADGLGTRNYELYSGGEAFKINFAIRIALSRLLARRAGAKLQSLFIDEGFGSQDEASRGRLIQAINAIKPDFARILVVTHIAEIKELFPIQIQVSKQDGVSSLNIVHTC